MLPAGRIVGIIEKVLLHSHERILERFLFNIFLPGFLRSNLEDDLGGRASLAHLPTSEMTGVYPFDHGDIRRQGILARIGRSIEVEVLIDGAALPTEKPGENQHEIANQIGMD